MARPTAIPREPRWETRAAPKGKDGQLDHNRALTGDDLRDFVDGKLFLYLRGFTQKANGPNTIEYKIGQIFGEIKNKIQSGYNLREIIDHIDELRFRSQTEKHELSHLYEAKIKNMGNAGRNGGEYYTPRPLIRAMVQVQWRKTHSGPLVAGSAFQRFTSCGSCAAACLVERVWSLNRLRWLRTRNCSCRKAVSSTCAMAWIVSGSEPGPGMSSHAPSRNTRRLAAPTCLVVDSSRRVKSRNSLSRSLLVRGKPGTS